MKAHMGGEQYLHEYLDKHQVAQINAIIQKLIENGPEIYEALNTSELKVVFNNLRELDSLGILEDNETNLMSQVFEELSRRNYADTAKYPPEFQGHDSSSLHSVTINGKTQYSLIDEKTLKGLTRLEEFLQGKRMDSRIDTDKYKKEIESKGYIDYKGFKIVFDGDLNAYVCVLR